MSLTLVAYDNQWPSRFADESTRIAAALERNVIAIEHVGSTAVPGLMGKPVLDIAIAVPDVANADACVRGMQQLGYEYRGTNGDDSQRRYYVKTVDRQRAVQVHLYIMPAPAWNEMLAFRDALRGDAELARAYAAEKQRVAEMVRWDKSAYSLTKGDFVQDVLKRLRETGQTHATGGSIMSAADNISSANPDFYIRPLVESDYNDWLPLWHQYLAYHGIWPEDAPAETWPRLMNPDEPMFAIGAFTGVQLEGIAHFIFHRHTWSRADSCFLSDVFTLPGARRRGIARALVEDVFVRAAKAGADNVYGTTLATNESSQKLYDLISSRLNLVVYRRDL